MLTFWYRVFFVFTQSEVTQCLLSIYRAQLQIISSAEVYLAGRRRAPHIYPIFCSPAAAAGPPTPTKEGVCLLITFMVINAHKEFFSNSL